MHSSPGLAPPDRRPLVRRVLHARVVRFVINGLVAASAHFLTLFLIVTLAKPTYVGVANGLAAVVGTSVSFLGARYFVFEGRAAPIHTQALKFVALYVFTALVHTGVVLLWSDVLSNDYRVGFLIATGCQLVLSYVGSKYLVFRKRA